MKIKAKRILTPENADKIKGGGHTLIFCATVELRQCLVAEGKYCGPNTASATAHEIKGPRNPWG
ncbi:hypothetical protein EV202_1393 [Bacteroides heparinolyticus]|uniref:Uncharacterized protein n=1 Tax=Prevotella heparinolytica TaxID=28113 RepID=A0A4R2M136_9BACE|nr:hypothetical protein EV202_1393 [Bacteroides heparinolyticus]